MTSGYDTSPTVSYASTKQSRRRPQRQTIPTSAGELTSRDLGAGQIQSRELLGCTMVSKDEALKRAREWLKLYADKSMSSDNAEALPDEAMEPLEDSLEQAEQEPIVTTYKEVTDTMNLLLSGDSKQVQIAQLMANAKLYITPPNDKPHVIDSNEKATQHMNEKLLEFLDVAMMFPNAKADLSVWERILIFAPQRTWVELTPEERKQIRFNFDGVENIQLNTEAKLKEKNALSQLSERR